MVGSRDVRHTVTTPGNHPKHVYRGQHRYIPVHPLSEDTPHGCYRRRSCNVPPHNGVRGYGSPARRPKPASLRPERKLTDDAYPCTIYGKDCKEPYCVNKNSEGTRHGELPPPCSG